jgi:pyruvate formate lyase activating enzyme
LDGPGIRFVVFTQGCNLRCGCCHNPDTWDCGGGEEYAPGEILHKALRFREYFGRDGGITVSGGEPLLQADEVKKLFSLCREQGVNTCLDTSGSILTEEVKDLLGVCDRVLLDVKYTNDGDYLRYVGCGMEQPLAFLDVLQEMQIPTTVRQVIIPTLNDTEENILRLKTLVQSHSCVDKVELLPFRKICQVKYDQMGKTFPFSHLPEPTKEKMAELEAILQ